ncbi:MAG: hypothetical protein OXM54_12880 [Acidimicrobiaceae bacterium]|nr:hypothetical protein [Acidimicrobiaceae bacterium]
MEFAVVPGVFWLGIDHPFGGWRLLQRVERPSNDAPEEPLSMMNQETYVNIKGLREQGWTIKEIAAETGFCPATVSKCLKQGPPSASPATAAL